MKSGGDELFEVGVVTGTHGLRGDLKVRPHTAGSSSVLRASQVFFRLPDGRTVRHEPIRALSHKGGVLLRLKGRDTIEAVQSLVGAVVLMRIEDLEELPEDEYYWYELEGLRVVDRTRGDLGILEDVFSTPAHDVYVVRGRYGEILFPAVDEFIREIDREAGCMAVELPEGLVPQADDF